MYFGSLISRLRVNEGLSWERVWRLVVVSHRKIYMPSLELCASALAQISLAILSAFVP